MHISSLHVYPLKGAAGIPLPHAQLDSFGIVHDRRWMIIGADGAFITQRSHPQLALLATDIDADALVLRSAAAGVVRLPLRPQHGTRLDVTVWSDEVAAIDTGAEAASFISAHLGTAARIVHMPDSTQRQVDLNYAAAGDRVSFADGFPLLLISQASLDGLNTRLAQPIGMVRFRPNIVVSGTAAHEEDTWRSVLLGTVACDVVKGCARCVVTTIDPATATVGREPLRTLATYRQRDGKVWFGQNVLHRARGVLHVGDAVSVLARTDLGSA